MKRTRKYKLKRKRYSRKNGGGGKPLDKVINPNIPVGKNYQQLGLFFKSDGFLNFLYRIIKNIYKKETFHNSYVGKFSVRKINIITPIEKIINDYEKKVKLNNFQIGKNYKNFLKSRNFDDNYKKFKDCISDINGYTIPNDNIESPKSNICDLDYSIFYYFTYILEKDFINGFHLDILKKNLTESKKVKETEVETEHNPVSQPIVISEEKQQEIIEEIKKIIKEREKKEREELEKKEEEEE
jgi:hypothetical protein